MADIPQEVLTEGPFKVLRIDFTNIPEAPSIENSAFCMNTTINALEKSGYVNKIVFYQKRDFEYDESCVKLLFEIKEFNQAITGHKSYLNYTVIVNTLKQSKVNALAVKSIIDTFFFDMQNMINSLLKSDPIAFYVRLKRYVREEQVKVDLTENSNVLTARKLFVSMLRKLISDMEKLSIIALSKDQLAGYDIGGRAIYSDFFKPLIKPDFMYTKLMSAYPKKGKPVQSYHLGESEITVFEFDDNVKRLYHLMPPEAKLSEDEFDLLDNARSILAEHKPSQEEFTDPLRLRDVFTNIGKDLIKDLAKYNNMVLSDDRIELLSKILIRYTIGFGLVEILLEDDKIQDININSPYGNTPLFVVHQDFGYCETNIFLTMTDVQSFASKLRIISGRPLDESNQILDTELVLPNATARVSVLTSPLDPTGLAFSFRRHRSKPWTLQLFLKVGMMNSLAAGLISFLVDGSRAFMIAGTRSSGKTSLLGSVIVEIMRKFRVITIEDTLELPVLQLVNLGYNIQQLKVASALAKGSTEMPATEGIRATLRLGDSALIIGEVRSEEAIAIYEAMRIGAAANVVAGTVHADSPYGVFDRVVNDIGVPKTSFKATDVILVAAPVKSADGLKSFRRIVRITEVRKNWTEDPLAERGFVDLMVYDVDSDQLKPTDALLNGDSEVLKAIGANVKEYAGNWDAIWHNILLRADLKQYLVDVAKKVNRQDLLEADFVLRANEKMHLLSSVISAKYKSKDIVEQYAIVKKEWQDWLDEEVKELK